MPDRADTVDGAPSSLVARSGLVRGFRSILSRLAEWRERSEQRKHLAAMSDRMLKDVGITRADAVREASKPFWQA